MPATANSVEIVDITEQMMRSQRVLSQLNWWVKVLENSVEFANAIANLKITRIGTRALPNQKAVERFLIERKELRS